MNRVNRHMADIGKGHSIYTYDPAALRVDAMAAEKNNAGVFHPVSFRTTAIEYVMEIKDGVSAMVLYSGVTIPVALPFEKLKQMIYEPNIRDGMVVDLMKVTGTAVKDVLAPKLAEKFNQQGPGLKTALKIKAYLRANAENRFVEFSFYETDIASLTPETGTRSKTKKSVSIKFNTAVKKGPFGSEALLDMPHEDYLLYVSSAKSQGVPELDLCKIFVDNPGKYGFNPG